MKDEELEKLIKMMEEMANAPKEEFGKRLPGEKCMYEIQRQETSEMKKLRKYTEELEKEITDAKVVLEDARKVIAEYDQKG